jgi:hypothetical protein
MAADVWDDWLCDICSAANSGLLTSCGQCGYPEGFKAEEPKQMSAADFPYYCWLCAHRCISATCSLCGGYAPFAPDTSKDPSPATSKNQSANLMDVQAHGETLFKVPAPPLKASHWRPRNYRAPQPPEPDPVRLYDFEEDAV